MSRRRGAKKKGATCSWGPAVMEEPPLGSEASATVRRVKVLPQAIALVGILCLSTSALAVPRSDLPLELTWSVPAGCPDSGVVRSGVERIVKDTRATPVMADGRIVAVEGGFKLELSMRVEDVTETRTVKAPLCATLADASAVLIALALDSKKDAPPPPASIERDDVLALEPGVDEPPSNGAHAPAARREEQRRAPRPEHSTGARPGEQPGARRSALQFGLALAPALELGTLPRASAGLWSHGVLRHGRFRAGVSGSVWLRQRPTFDGDGRAGAAFDMLQGALFGCFMSPLWRLALGPCANGQVSYVVVEGFGIRMPQRQATLWPSVGAGLLGEWSFGRVGLFARADLAASIGAPSFALMTRAADGTSLYDPSGIVSRFVVGAEIVIP